MKIKGKMSHLEGKANIHDEFNDASENITL